jgi:hypothetical protein
MSAPSVPVLNPATGEMLASQEDLAMLMTAEQVKPLAESRGEIAYAAPFIVFEDADLDAAVAVRSRASTVTPARPAPARIGCSCTMPCTREFARKLKSQWIAQTTLGKRLHRIRAATDINAARSEEPCFRKPEALRCEACNPLSSRAIEFFNGAWTRNITASGKH